MIVYTVWEYIIDYPENGGGEHLLRIFQDKEEAEKYCEQMEKEAEEYEEDATYYIEKWQVY